MVLNVINKISKNFGWVLLILVAALVPKHAHAREKADIKHTLNYAGADTTRLILSARRCLFNSMLQAVTKKPDPSAEPPATWRNLLKANSEQFEAIKFRPSRCTEKTIKIAIVCLPSVNGMMNIPLGCSTGRFAMLVRADAELTLGYDVPANEGTPDHARQTVEQELERLKISADVDLKGWYDLQGGCRKDCYIAIFTKETMQESELAHIADALITSARQSMIKAKIPELKITNKDELWKVMAERNTQSQVPPVDTAPVSTVINQ